MHAGKRNIDLYPENWHQFVF